MNAKEALAAGHHALLNALEGISDRDAESGILVGDWNVKDSVAHLAALEHVLEEIVNSQLASERPEEIPHLTKFRDMTPEDFNKYHYEERKFTPYSEILAELNSSHKHVASEMYLITNDMMKRSGIIPWFDKRYSLEDFIINVNYKTKLEYASLIVKFKERLNKLKQQPSKGPS